MSTYYECHVTISPVFDSELDRAREIAKAFNFRVADLLMQRGRPDTPERSSKDTFMTGRDDDLSKIQARMTGLDFALRNAGYDVWRLKIEHVIYDERTKR